MLTQIKLTNFKCFKEETAIPLSKFNLFTGVNGAGKSTVLQALLLMRQSIEHNPYTTELILNGSCVNLGSFDDIRNREISKEKAIFFEFLYSHGQDRLSIRDHLEPKADEMSLLVRHVEINLQYQFDTVEELVTETVSNTLNFDEETGLYYPEGKDVYQQGSSFKLNTPSALYLANMIGIIGEAVESMHVGFNFDIDNIHFISADRIGPQEVYKKSPLSDFPHVGTNGEMVVNLLNKLSNHPVNEALYLAETPGILGENQATLLVQTQAWLGKILTPLSLKINPLRVNLLELLIGDSKPSNVGFGYSSILPIIVTGLIAKPGEKIIIENPEIHLHPKAQSALIDFLVKVANTGVQIFIESHSDHVLNALRVATKNGLLEPEDSSVLFFNRNAVSKANEITSILIDEKGKLHRKTDEGTMAKIPQGFFDEWTNAMAKLF